GAPPPRWVPAAWRPRLPRRASRWRPAATCASPPVCTATPCGASKRERTAPGSFRARRRPPRASSGSPARCAPPAPSPSMREPCSPRNRYLRGAVDADHIGELMEGLGKAAIDAAAVLALAPAQQKNDALAAAAAAVRARGAAILAANERDMSGARAVHLSGP